MFSAIPTFWRIRGKRIVAIRDRYLSAEVMGVNVWGYRILSFGVSSFMVGISGSLWAHYVQVISDEHFTIVNSLREGTFGLLVVLFIIFEPDGLAHRWNKIKAYWKLWPFSY